MGQRGEWNAQVYRDELMHQEDDGDKKSKDKSEEKVRLHFRFSTSVHTDVA